MKKISINLLKITLLLIIVMCQSAFISQVSAAKKESNLTLDYNGGKNVVNGLKREVAIDYGDDDIFTIVEYKDKIAKINCEFLGWSQDKNAKEPDPLYTPGKQVVIKNKTTIYAIWEKKVVLLDYNGGHKKGSDITREYAIDYGDDDVYTMIDYKNIIEKDNCEFLGWSENKNAKEPEALYTVGNQVKIMNKITLYAVWKKKEEPTKPKPDPIKPNDPEPVEPVEPTPEFDIGKSLMSAFKKIFEWLIKFLENIMR